MHRRHNSKRTPPQRWRGELGRFIKFNIVGLLNTAIDNLVYALLNSVLGWGFVVSKSISYTCGMLNSWFFNSRWTFRGKETNISRVVGFLIINVAAWGVQVLILWVCKTQFGLEGLLASLIATPFSILVNFVGNRLFVFR